MSELRTIRVLPAWAEDLRRRYVRGEASMFVLHGNVFDAVVHDGLRSLSAFLTDVLLSETKDTIVTYNVATGGHFAKRAPGIEPDEDLAAAGEKDKALAALERAKQPPTCFLARHAIGDWGELEPTDVAENEYSVAHGFRLLSSYRTDAGKRLWIITEADRSSTTLLLPEEY